MIRMIQSNSAGHAKAYFSEALLKADYYTNDQELQGKFHGKLADRLKLDEVVAKEAFFSLCENIHPKDGTHLTPRTKDERTVGYDINFHCPKSVSIVHVLSKDDHILEAFQDSVKETMQDIETDAQTRVRKSGQYYDRQTGELVWADFVHQTARPVDDHLPDPHLHSHCFVFNMTWDETEQQIKAAKFKDIKRDMPYYQSRFHKRLSDKLIDLGYKVRLTDKSFELEGVPQNVIDLFSKRTDEIGRVAKEKGITDAKQLSELGARTRSKKQKGLSMAELKAAWRLQIKALGDPAENGDKAVRHDLHKVQQWLKAEQCIDHTLSHSFERASVIPERRLLAKAYQYAIGQNAVNLDGITKAFLQDDRLIHVKEGSRLMSTTREVLAEEKQMVELAQQGLGKLKPLYTKVPDLKLNEQQADAVTHLLTTSNRVTIIRGAAGTGKTTLMNEATELMERAGKKVFVVAPTSQASRGVLKEEGFDKADTVAGLLVNKQLQQDLEGQVLWVDEAGLLGTKDMTSLLKLATDKNARLILGGDTRQHASVVRGDALRILNTIGGIKTAEVSKIYRQRDPVYKSVVEKLSKGHVATAFIQLDQMNAIRTTDPLKPNEDLVKDYVKTLSKGKSALIISPTHKNGEEVTKAVRIELRRAGLIGKKEVSVDRLVNTNMTVAQKADWRNFEPGQVVQFNQHTTGIKRGSIWSVNEIINKQIKLTNDKKEIAFLPTEKPEHYDIFKKTSIGLSKGDKVHITRNSYDEQDKRLNNGQALEVIAVTKIAILLTNRQSKNTYTLSPEFGHLTHAHCITSHSAQGKTVDEVLISQPGTTFSATDAKQFYVSVSRARDAVKIYTDDKAALLEYAAEIGDRQSALELVGNKHSSIDYFIQQHLRDDVRQPSRLQDTKPNRDTKPKKDQDYEPGI